MNKGISDVEDFPAKKIRTWRIVLVSVAVVLAVSLAVYALYPHLLGKINSSESQSGSKPASVIDSKSEQKTEQEPARVMASAEYPSSSDPSEVRLDGYDAYMSDVMRVVFSDARDENCVFSPLSLYLALSMAAEITDGNSLLHQPDLDSLRSFSGSLWRSCLQEGTDEKLMLGNSLWMNSDWECDQTLMETLTGYYFASAFSGDPTSEEYNQMFREWIRTQTDGLIENPDICLDPDMVLGLYSTVNYAAKWTNPFAMDAVPGCIFHAPSGDISCAFLNLERATLQEFCGDHFSCVEKALNGNGSVRFILPEKGVTPQELLQDEELLLFLSTDSEGWGRAETHDNSKMMMPQIDFSTHQDLKGILDTLGVKDVFRSSDADFGKISGESQGLEISSVEQDNRVIMDAEGVKAVSITSVQIAIGRSEEPEPDWEFILDRPFLFEIVSESGVPLFVGIVNVPWTIW